MRPDVITFSALISACANAGQCDRALELFETMRGSFASVQPDVVIILLWDRGVLQIYPYVRFTKDFHFCG